MFFLTSPCVLSRKFPRSPSSDDAELENLEVSFFQFTTSSPHPAARETVLHLSAIAEDLRPLVTIEIFGDILLLVLEFVEPQEDRLCIYNWKTGDWLLVCVQNTLYAFIHGHLYRIKELSATPGRV